MLMNPYILTVMRVDVAVHLSGVDCVCAGDDAVQLHSAFDLVIIAGDGAVRVVSSPSGPCRPRLAEGGQRSCRRLDVELVNVEDGEVVWVATRCS